jgi:Fe-S cluster biogenesis protein NfuA
MKNISLKIEPTNNNSVLKFTADTVLISGSYQFNNINDAKNSPLAEQLFHLPFVKRVLISANFVAVERYTSVEWSDVKEALKEEIENYLNNPGVLVLEEKEPEKKGPVEVYSEVTPNPSVLKFVSNKKLVNADLEYKNIEEAINSPIATELFNFSFVKEVFISENYISITKFDVVEWNEITTELRSFIKQYITDGKTIVRAGVQTENKQQAANNSSEELELDPVSKQIVSILDEYIRPAVAADGGNILFQSYEESSKTVNVILQGACSGCPSSTITLKNGIENMLKQLIPGKIEEVVAVNY